MGFPNSVPLPRCPAKDYAKLYKFQQAGNHEHDGKTHICDECRCTAVAGRGTKGDYYGIGEDTGHYGVGFCARHEKGRNASKAAEFAANHLRALQQHGKAVSVREDYRMVAQQEAEIAQNEKAIREGLDLVVEKLQDFRARCVADDHVESEVSTVIRELSEQLSKVEVVDDKQLAIIQNTLDEWLVRLNNLTEACSGKVIPMTDKTKIQLAAQLGKTIADIEKHRFSMNTNEYLHKDELAIRIPMMISASYRYIHNEADRVAWLEEFKNIWKSAQPGVRNASKQAEG